MVVRRSTGTRRTAAPAKAVPRKAAPVARKKDVTEYAEKPATAYHKAFARWIVQEVGFDPETASSKRAAFLKGVSIATAARPSFNDSDFIEEWRESAGETKRGPKPKAAADPAGRRRKAAPEPVEEEEEFEEEEDDFEEDSEDSEDEEFEEEEDDSESDEDEEFEEEEEAPAPKRRAPAAPAKAAANSRARAAAPARKAAAPAKKATRAKPAADDDEFLF